MAAKTIFDEMYNSVLEGEQELAEEIAQKAVAEGVSPMQCLDDGYLMGIAEVGRLYSAGEMFLPELVAAAEAMKAALAVLEPMMKEQSTQRRSMGRVVIGTMHEDIHDIGKSIVASMLTANGFEVFDLGVNVPSAVFVEKVKELRPDVLGLSALLTTTMPQQKIVLNALAEAGLRDKVKVLVGGAPVTQSWADEIGADGFAEDAIAAVILVKKLS